MQFQLLFLVGAALLLSLLQLFICSGICSESFECGDDIYSYPFWGKNRPASCGVLEFGLDCVFAQTEIEIRNSDINSRTYIVLNISEANQIMTIVRSDVRNFGLGGYACPSEFLNDSAVNDYKNLFEYVYGTLTYTLFYGCPFNVSYDSERAYCYVNSTITNRRTYSSVYLTADSVGSTAPYQNTSKCQGAILIPVRASSVHLSTNGILQNGFDVTYAGSYHSDCANCTNSGGSCGTTTGIDSTGFQCYCRDGTSQTRSCPPPETQATVRASPIEWYAVKVFPYPCKKPIQQGYDVQHTHPHTPPKYAKPELDEEYAHTA
ncbi:hypothetical protein GIB67_018120 [Kingdonia uniflora]|uniref:Uncharacterized protein n=1 Tax=Kingdonia uniflora TaxID=39325 RepID=A0A7J7NWM3_9MAGN|nr:hypothetical protein GIB67_018120 [Kingdonia uniflora]